MKKLTTLTFALSLCGAFAAQQDDIHQGFGQGVGIGIGNGSGCRLATVEQHMRLLIGPLTLTGEQQDKIGRILLEQFAQWRDVQDDPARLRKLREESSARVRDVLRDDQKGRFYDIQREKDQNCSIIWSLGKR